MYALVRHPGAYEAPEGVTPVEADMEQLDRDSLPKVDAVAHFAQANVPFPEEAGTLYAVNTGSTLVLLDSLDGRAQRLTAQFARVLFPASCRDDVLEARNALALRSRSRRLAAVMWLSTASSPHQRSAARNRPRQLSAGCPTEYTPGSTA